jgi:hypothetical protein
VTALPRREGKSLIRRGKFDGVVQRPTSTVGTNKSLAAKHHARHGDMDRHVCLLSACAIHYPKRWP